MSSPVISVEHVSKSYRLGTIGGGTLKGDLSRWWARVRKRPDPLLKIGEEDKARRVGEQFLALRDVSFEVKEGDVLGLIGRNGAGKSTLLKILSRVTAPTSGEIKIRGRIASLLEVGTGFHPELTGRENVFLNGAILGMTKSEIRRKFDEIVAFSGIEEFIDTPVKRYSSGMYVRLAFAVAAHLEPEILIVDEVLAVGDAAFQKKCLGKMQEVSRGGRTVLFVSHNMAAVASLCKTGLFLSDGHIVEYGPAGGVLTSYLQQAKRLVYSREPSRCNETGDYITEAWLEGVDGRGQSRRISEVKSGAVIELVVRGRINSRRPQYLIASFWDEVRLPLWELSATQDDGNLFPANQASELRVKIALPKLRTSMLSIDLALGSSHFFEDHVADAICCTVQSEYSHVGGTQRFPLAMDASYSSKAVVIESLS